ncbi:MAG: four helix bundle protein [Oscillospiraceae bacterium]|nr:four helix bundle protein [Oscillospiraceae bacterium]MBR6657563.1 four helix bundle protein [Oscillospiraceae bacterium]
MESITERKSFDFAVRIVKLYDFLKNRKKEFIISKQLLRSGTSIGANVSEAEQAQSRADFISKLSIALKEAHETKYWLRLLSETGFLDRKQSDSILSDCSEIEKILVSILNTSKSKI